MLSKKSDPRAMLPKRSVNVPAICNNRFDGNASSVQMNTAPLPRPPDSSANCTVSASWIHSWDLPLPASPHISVMPRVAMPLRVIASSAEQPNVMYIHCSRISVMHWVAAISFELEIEVSSIDQSFSPDFKGRTWAFAAADFTVWISLSVSPIRLRAMVDAVSISPLSSKPSVSRISHCNLHLLTDNR